MAFSGAAQFPAPQWRRGSRAAFMFIIVTVMLDFLAFGIIAPVLPDLIKQFEGGNIARASDITGYFGFAWNLMQFLFLPVLGAWSDRFGRRPVILISCLGLGLDYIFMAMAPSLRWLFVGRIDFGDYGVECVHGVCVHHGYCRAGATRETVWNAGSGVWRGICDRAGGGRTAGALQFAGAVLGGGGVEPGEFSVWIVCAAGIAGGRKAGKIGMAHGESAGVVDAAAIASGAGGAVDRGDAVLSGAPGAAERVGAVHGISLRVEPAEAWDISLGVVGVCAAIVSGGLVGPYVKKFGERFSLTYRDCFLACWDLWDLGLAWTGWGALAAIPFIALWGVAGPAMQSLMSQRVDASSQGKLQGAINSLRALTGMAGPLLFTQVFSAAIAEEGWLHVPGAAYFLAAVLLVGAWCWRWW